MKGENEYSEELIELLDRLDNLRNSTKESMVVGDDYIIKGINFYEKAIKKINPKEINSDTVFEIGIKMERMIANMENKTQSVNCYFNLGIMECHAVLHNYYLSLCEKREIKKKIK